MKLTDRSGKVTKMSPTATTHANPEHKRVETVGDKNGRVKDADKPFQPRRFHIKKNQYTGLFDVLLTITHLDMNKKPYPFEAYVCEHKDLVSAMNCALGIDCVNSDIPVGRLH